MFDIDKPDITKKEKEMLISCINEGSIGQGKYVLKFEDEFAGFCGMRYGCATTSGTTALHLALSALDIKKGDDVLVPSLTFIASVSPVSFCGANPVFVDCDPKTFCMDPNDLRKKITRHSKAVIPVHLYGNVCDMDTISSIAKKHNLKIIEDCAEAHGALYRGKPVGKFSHIAFFSFYKNKHITTGEGGMCLTNNNLLSERMRLLRSHGKKKAECLQGEDFAQKQFLSSTLGFNYRMTDLQAAIGLAQLKRVKSAVVRRESNAKRYTSLLKGLDVVLPYYDKSIIKHVYWMYPILLRTPELKVKVMLKFRKQGIRLRPFFYPCHLQPFYRNYKNCCPVSEDISQRGIVLPTIQTLKVSQIRIIVNLLKEILRKEV